MFMSVQPEVRLRPPPRLSLKPMSLAHRLALALVWVTVASSCIVFVEPAPVDLLTCGLFILLPTLGLYVWKQKTAALCAVLLPISALQFVGANFAFEPGTAMTHNLVSLYLFGAAVVFAGFIAKRPHVHARLILNAYLAGVLMAASLGVIGYLDLIPGAYENLTRYDRATGLFKDPNVFGPFLIPGLLTALHMWLTAPLARGGPALIYTALISAGLVLSLSRGAWAAAALASAMYLYFYLLNARRNVERLKVAGFVVLGTTLIALVLAAAMQSQTISRLIDERASLTQPYDEGPEGRFGGQEKAFALILESPLGLGGQQFAPHVHHEEPHNVFLNLFLSSGWTGGVLYLGLCVSLIVGGARHALIPTRTRGLFVIAYASLVSMILLGLIIDSDHWRHFYLLIGIVVGLMAADQTKVREGRIVADRRPILMNPVLIIPPARRTGRLKRRLPPMLSGNPVLASAHGRASTTRRPARIR